MVSPGSSAGALPSAEAPSPVSHTSAQDEGLPAEAGLPPELVAQDELALLRARIRELEQGARRDDRADALLSMLSHELRSPLQSLILNVDASLRRMDEPSAQPAPAWVGDKLHRQRRTAARLKLLIDTFLDVGQIANGELRFEQEEVDLGELVSDVVGRMRDDLAWAHCLSRLDVSVDVIGQWDRLQMDLVVTNLLSNAIKYGAGSPVTISVWGTAQTASVRIKDHGPGIARADHQRIFDKFTRLESPSKVGGFGLGLWIVRHIVEAMNGTIEVDSDPGRGAAFTVTLPRLAPPQGS
jgi:signal transduction histidine kinase